MTSPNPWTSILALALATSALTGCRGDGGPPQVVFESQRKLDGTNAANANGTINIWIVGSDAKGLRPLTTVTAARANSGSAEWSPDGSKIVFGSTRKLDQSDALNLNGVDNVWRVNADGTGLMPLTTSTAAFVTNEFPKWSPDGKSVVFDSSRQLDGTDGENVNGTRNIWLVNADGSNLRPLTRATAIIADSGGPQWSRDGTKIVFSSFRKLDGTDAPGTVLNIWRINADGTSLVPITRTNAVFNSDPRWSPDGTKVLFISTRALDGTDTLNTGPTSNLWVVNADGSGLRPITNNTARRADNSSGQWAPDGSKIVFASTRKLDGTDAANANDTANIWRVNSDGSGLMPLTHGTASGAESVAPRWSHDGTEVVFSSARNLDGTDSSDPNLTTNIWLMNADGTGLTPLTTATSGASDSPSFEP